MEGREGGKGKGDGMGKEGGRRKGEGQPACSQPKIFWPTTAPD